MSFQITENVKFVGKIDWALRKFHGEQLSTNKGSSYNAYLIQDKKSVLIDGVWGPFAKEFIDNLEKIIGVKNIDYVVALHAEPDHSQALANILEIKPDMPIYCSQNATKSLKGYYHKDWNFVTVKTGDKLNINNNINDNINDSKKNDNDTNNTNTNNNANINSNNANLIFVEATMLHWPDQMMTYFDKDKILFSSDVFGQHLASEFMYDDKVDISELHFEALKYYANIVAPYSKKVIAKLDEMKTLNLPISIIAPSHGILWKNNPEYIINKYSEWANEYKENQITIIYDTMYGSTRKMAEALADGIKQKDINATVKLFNLSTADNSDVIAETFRSKAILVGSPTYNNGILNAIAAYLEELKGIRLSNKKAAAFGSFGWASASPKVISKMLTESGFEIFEPNFIAVNWNPTEDALNECKEFGSKFAEFCK